MIFSLRERGVRGVVLDIEGTTTPLSFVHDVLFPYARAHLREYLQAHRETAELRDVVRLLRDEHAADVARGELAPELRDSPADAGLASLAAYVEWLMDRDRKSPGLKLLQGRIWERGYRDGTLRGEVFPDVPAALERWRAAELDVAIFSSGSVLAQRLLFGSTASGDLTRFAGHFFDTSVGAKRSPESYRRIAEMMGHACARLLFISDVSEELDAARGAGVQTLLCIRPGNVKQPASDVEAVRSFDEVAA